MEDRKLTTEEVQATLLELAKEGRVAVRLCDDGIVRFLASQYATPEDIEYTKVWVTDPFFNGCSDNPIRIH
jgi:hypothetical protein